MPLKINFYLENLIWLFVQYFGEAFIDYEHITGIIFAYTEKDIPDQKQNLYFEIIISKNQGG